MISAKVEEKNPLVCALESSKTGPVSYQKAEANARLIAAAPDLLEALIDARKAFVFATAALATGKPPSDEVCARIIAKCTPDSDIGKMSAAIAKATPKESTP